MNWLAERISRRRSLAAAGVSISLPFLESLPCRAEQPTERHSNVSDAPRLVCMGVALSLYPDEWNPTETGREYRAPRLIEPLEGLRSDFSLISNADHPGVSGGHKGTPAFLSGVYQPERVGQSIVIRNQITLDQYVASHTDVSETRFASLQLGAAAGGPSESLSWNEKGVPLLAEGDPRKVFARLFVDDANPAARVRSMKLSRSVLDVVREDAKALQSELSGEDGRTVDDYLSSVRDVERRIEKQLQWVTTPKPGVPPLESRPTHYHENLDLNLELAALALQTDSTRVVTVELPGSGMPIDAGKVRTANYHGQSHHGKDPKVVEELIQIELMHTRSLAKFLNRLRSIPAGDGTLLDRTQVLFGSGLGNGSSHSNRDLPVLLAGGGLKHGQHIRLAEQTPLCNVFVTMLQRMGIETDKFAGSNGNVNEFLIA